MINDQRVIEVTVDSPGTDDRYDVSFDELGITAEVARSMKATILDKNPSTGVNRSNIGDASLDPANSRLTITEGSDGFSDGDVFHVLLYMPIGPVSGTSRSS